MAVDGSPTMTLIIGERMTDPDICASESAELVCF